MGSVFKNPTTKTRYIPKAVQHEQHLQKQVCSYLKIKYPNIIFRSDFSSGMKLSINQAMIHKSLQSSRSFPDIQILQPSRGYHGLFIELKKEGTRIYLTTGPRKGQLTADQHIQEQALMLKHLNNLGYCARFGVGFEKTQKLIDWYLNPNYKPQEDQTLF